MFHVVDCRGHVCHAGHENLRIQYKVKTKYCAKSCWDAYLFLVISRQLNMAGF